jgi:CheY-like chemotaxis protein
MSHELRTPLNAVLGFSHLMNNAPDVTDEQSKNLEIITHSGEHLLNLINNVLDISKIESGRVELEESPIDLQQMLQELKSLMYVRAAEKGLAFNLEQSPDLPRHICVDGGKLRQVLINLIGNAIKYTVHGSVKLNAVLLSQLDSERVKLQFEVADTGPGIRVDDRERIFTPFVQLGDRPPTEAGTGLGLAISKQHIELMKGQIGVTSEAGVGTVFHFEIPVTLLPSEESPAAPTRGRVLGQAEGEPVYRLLIVEDQPENRLLLRQLLDPLGFELREVVNGQQAVEIFDQWRPHLIFMDIRMPVMDGLQATHRIKASEAGEQTHIVALTAHALEEERKEILAAGCDDFIRKPYTYPEILDALTRHLGVRFIYEEEAESPAGVSLDAAALSGLPEEQRCLLEQALIRIDLKAVKSVIEAIYVQNPILANALDTLANDLQFGRILQLVRANQVGRQSEIEAGEER